MTLGMDGSAALLADMVRRQQSFFFARIGDGVLELLSGRPGKTCDGEAYSEPLRAAVWDCLESLISVDTWHGDWSGASNGSAPRFVAEWRATIQPEPSQLLHFECLLLNRDSQQLAGFYRAVRADQRKKAYLGSHANSETAAVLLDLDPIPCPMHGLFAQIDKVSSRLERMAPDLLLFGAGMAGLVAAVRYWESRDRKVTCIHLGSALDVLATNRKTRSGQLTKVQAFQMLRDIL